MKENILTVNNNPLHEEILKKIDEKIKSGLNENVVIERSSASVLPWGPLAQHPSIF